jgi:hypothetical protein
MHKTIRTGNLEAKTCDSHLLQSGEHVTGEVVEWFPKDGGGEYCYTLAYWNKTPEGFELKFVGDRPFRCESSTVFWDLAKELQGYLDEQFSLMEEEE